MRLILFVILWMGLRFIIASQQKKRKTPKKMTQSQEPALQTMEDFFRQLTQTGKTIKQQTQRENKKLMPRERNNQKVFVPLANDMSAENMDVPDMVSEPMEAETMTAENMEAEPMIAEKIGTEDGLSLDLEEEYLPVTAVNNPWKGKINKKNIRTGFIMAQLLAKPRSLNPYHYEQ